MPPVTVVAAAGCPWAAPLPPYAIGRLGTVTASVTPARPRRPAPTTEPARPARPLPGSGYSGPRAPARAAPAARRWSPSQPPVRAPVRRRPAPVGALATPRAGRGRWHDRPGRAPSRPGSTATRPEPWHGAPDGAAPP